MRLWGLEAQRGRYPPIQKGRKVSKRYAGRRMCSCLSTVRGSIKRTRYGKRLPSTNRSLAAPRRADGIRAVSPSNTTSPCTASHWARRPNGPFDGVFFASVHAILLRLCLTAGQPDLYLFQSLSVTLLFLSPPNIGRFAPSFTARFCALPFRRAPHCLLLSFYLLRRRSQSLTTAASPSSMPLL